MMNDNICIILVAPQMGENIGAAARAMKNFGLKSLRIISPRDGWPNEKAISTSTHAQDVIQNAKIFHSLTEAISDLNILYATSAQPRDMNKPVISSRTIASKLLAEAQVGIMFGRESSGLSNEEISFADAIINIDTSSDYTSLNIASAVCIVCYELMELRESTTSKQNILLPTKSETLHFLDYLFSELECRGFFRVPEKKKLMQQNILNTFTRIDNLSKSELQTLRGMLSILTKK